MEDVVGRREGVGRLGVEDGSEKRMVLLEPTVAGLEALWGGL